MTRAMKRVPRAGRWRQPPAALKRGHADDAGNCRGSAGNPSPRTRGSVVREEALRRLEEAGRQNVPQGKRRQAAEEQHRKAFDAERHTSNGGECCLIVSDSRSSLAVESAPDMLHAIEAARTQLLGRKRPSKAGDRPGRILDSFGRQVRSAFEAAGRAEPADDDVSKSVSALVVRTQPSGREQAAGRRIYKRRSGIQRSDRAVQVQIDQNQKEIEGLLVAAGTGDEEAFRHRASQHDMRRKLEDADSATRNALRRLAGGGDAFTVLGRRSWATRLLKHLLPIAATWKKRYARGRRTRPMPRTSAGS